MVNMCRLNHTQVLRIIFIGLAGASLSYGGDLSPDRWPKAERERLEKLESQTMSPLEARSVVGSGGLVSATASAIGAYAGAQALRQGGNAADAAVATALTQIATQLGSTVSYAGIFTVVYYDAKSHKVYSMDAGFNSYLEENDPKSIPVSDLGPLPVNGAPKATEGGAKGRETLVPGFMAGAEGLHKRFGRLPFRDLFEPAIWYAEHGVRLSHALEYFFTVRAKFLNRTPEGRQFVRQGGREVPKAGALFIQGELAKTLKAISEDGSRYMYTGQWAKDFVRTVRRDGARATARDMERYKPIWSEPYKEAVFGHTIYVNGPPHRGAFGLFLGLNLAEALNLDQKGPYWTDAGTFRDLARIGQIAATSPALDRRTLRALEGKGFDLTADAQLGKAFARGVAPLLGEVFAPPPRNEPKHSNAIVVVDKDGNVAAVTHTINAVIWGDTGIVVGGIPIPDSAGFQQFELGKMKPGERVQHQIIDTIAFEGEAPVLATGSIGSSLTAESIRVLLCVLGKRQGLATVMAAPPLLSAIDFESGSKSPAQKPVSIPRGAYSDEMIEKLKEQGVSVTKLDPATAAALRGTLAAVVIDSKTRKRTAVNQPGVMVFNVAE
jgi:gamma-glutamyltranspeptidase / glutathione hydrolase